MSMSDIDMSMSQCTNDLSLYSPQSELSKSTQIWVENRALSSVPSICIGIFLAGSNKYLHSVASCFQRYTHVRPSLTKGLTQKKHSIWGKLHWDLPPPLRLERIKALHRSECEILQETTGTTMYVLRLQTAPLWLDGRAWRREVGMGCSSSNTPYSVLVVSIGRGSVKYGRVAPWYKNSKCNLCTQRALGTCG